MPTYEIEDIKPENIVGIIKLPTKSKEYSSFIVYPSSSDSEISTESTQRFGNAEGLLSRKDLNKILLQIKELLSSRERYSQEKLTHRGVLSKVSNLFRRKNQR